MYQTLLGTWPFSAEEVDENYVGRIHHYMLKAIKEAKVNSSWVQPNEDWESAMGRFVGDSLKPDHAFRSKIEPAAARIAWHGMLNSLTQTILKFTVPGVPDIYQGTELWDFSLADPDNRRPVDFSSHQQILEEIQKESVDALFKSWQDGRVKMLIITRLLRLRQAAPALFQNGRLLFVLRERRTGRLLRRVFPGTGFTKDARDCASIHHTLGSGWIRL